MDTFSRVVNEPNRVNMMKQIWKNKNGFTTPIAIGVSVVTIVLIMSMARTIQVSTQQTVQNNRMDNMNRLLETGLYHAIGSLATNPDLYDLIDPDTFHGKGFAYPLIDDPDAQPDPIVNGFQNYVFPSNVVPGGYYVVTNAVMPVVAEILQSDSDGDPIPDGMGGFEIASEARGQMFSRLHSHVRVSDATEYFWAIKEKLVIGVGTDAGNGKVYSRQLEFDTTGTGWNTKVLSAEYVLPPAGNLEPDVTAGFYNYPAVSEDIAISEPTTGANAHKPIGRKNPILFPQLMDTDMARYAEKAHMGEADEHSKCDFTQDLNGDGEVHIYPPGYYTSSGNSHADDDYSAALGGNHTSDPGDHVYLCNGNVEIGTDWTKPTYVHGQVIIVATGTVLIKGSIENHTLDDSDLPDEAGADENTRSKAHQLVLLTPSDVTITDDWNTDPGVAHTQTIHAALIAPYGHLKATDYGSDVTFHNFMKLRFMGSMILNSIENDPPDNLRTVFADETTDGTPARIYSYMESLKTNPPPDIPAITEIYYSVEESGGIRDESDFSSSFWGQYN